MFMFMIMFMFIAAKSVLRTRCKLGGGGHSSAKMSFKGATGYIAQDEDSNLPTLGRAF